MAERYFILAGRQHEIAAQQSGYGMTMILCNWSVQAESIFPNCVKLPSQRNNREAVMQQPCVACIMGEILISPVNERQNKGNSAVRVLEQQRPIPFRGVLRANCYKI